MDAQQSTAVLHEKTIQLHLLWRIFHRRSFKSTGICNVRLYERASRYL